VVDIVERSASVQLSFEITLLESERVPGNFARWLVFCGDPAFNVRGDRAPNLVIHD
jgi:hypothetical protein